MTGALTSKIETIERYLEPALTDDAMTLTAEDVLEKAAGAGTEAGEPAY